VNTTGTVDHVMERYLDRAISQAEDAQANAVVLRVDTPGGDIGAMKQIVGRIERARVPVITWVGPPGAEAASAGTFVTMAGHIAAMAPNTTIGAASPVTSSGGDITGTLGKKVENDTVAFARGVAELHGRNADWAEQAVRDAISATPQEAVDQHVVDLVAPSLDALLAAVQGRKITLLNTDTVILNVATVPRVEISPNLYERLLQIISDPLVVSILLVLGVLGLAGEIFLTGTFFPGTVGVISLLLAFVGLGTLLPGEAAVALMLVGLALFAMEFFVPSGGVLGAGAAVAVVLGLSIVLGQLSTAMTVRGLLTTLAIVVGTVTLLIAAAFVIVARGYMARTEESGGRLL
jgi:membrane-bound serine protease (ClpP class)